MVMTSEEEEGKKRRSLMSLSCLELSSSFQLILSARSLIL